MDLARLKLAIIDNLSDDLLSKEWLHLKRQEASCHSTGKGFLTKHPSKRARELIKRVKG
jgi:hypothetical protein